jgi:hypothetical protein
MSTDGSPFRHRRGPKDLSTSKDTIVIKVGRCRRDARGHATTWGYRTVLVFPRLRPEEWGPALLRRLQEPKRQKEALSHCFGLAKLWTLAGANWFSTLPRTVTGEWDLYPDGKNVFSTGEELWQLTVVLFGRSTTPAAFERLMETVIRGLLSRMSRVNGLSDRD